MNKESQPRAGSGKTLRKYRTAMIDLFEQEEPTILYIDKIIKKYKLYASDQFIVLEKSIQKYT